MSQLLRCHIYAPRTYAENGDSPVTILRDVYSWSAVVAQANRFDGHHLEFPLTTRDVLFSLQNFSTIDIEQVGVGIIARGIITNPKQQIKETDEGRIVLDLANITDQGLEVNTGLSYVDQEALGSVVYNLGQMRTKGESVLVYNPSLSPTGYFSNGLANTKLTLGSTTGWSASYIDDGSLINSSAPVTWFNMNGCTSNGNTIQRVNSGTFGYQGIGGVGAPAHNDTANTASFQWQIVTPSVCEAGVSSNPVIGTPSFGFDFSNPHIVGTIWHGTWTVIENGGLNVAHSGDFQGNTPFMVTYIPGSPAIMQYWVSGVMVYSSTNTGMPLYPVTYFATPGGEVDNAIFSHITLASQAWWQVTYSKITQTGAMLQLAQDTGLWVREGSDVTGSPLRTFELGPLGSAATVSVIDGRGGDLKKMLANPNIRVVKEITSYDVDTSNTFTVSTPLGGGNGPAQVTIELLWRILNDPTFEYFYQKVGYNLANVWPEYDSNFTVHRYPTINSGYEYFIVWEPAFYPVGWSGFINGGSIATNSLGYKEGGPSANSQFIYPQDATVAEQLATQRFLYKAWIEIMKRAVVPHITMQFTTYGDWRPPKGGERVHIDYTKIAQDKLGPWVPTHILTGTDPLYNPDPRVMKVERQASGDSASYDTWTISNLGIYPDDPSTTASNVATQVVALQVQEQNSVSTSHLNPSFSEADASHPVVLPFYFLPTTFKVNAFYLYIGLYPFRQPIAPDGNTVLFYNASGTTLQLQTLSVDIALPATSDLNAQKGEIGGAFDHLHEFSIAHGLQNFTISKTPDTIAPDKYLWVASANNLSQIFTNGSGGAVQTGTGLINVDLKNTTHGHSVLSAGTQIAHIPSLTVLGSLPQHWHQIPPGIKDLTTAPGVSVQIDSGDGVLVDRTAQLIDAISLQGPTASGWGDGSLIEISRFMNTPGKICRVQLTPQGDAANNSRVRICWAGTITEAAGGLGFIVKSSM